MKKIILACFLVLITFSCTDATRSNLSAYGSEHLIELYSGGKKVREWTSTGKVLSEQESDGYKFRCKDTDKLVRVTGDLVITIKQGLK